MLELNVTLLFIYIFIFCRLLLVISWAMKISKFKLQGTYLGA